MTVREIQGYLLEMYGTEVSPDLISKVTDEVMAEVVAWQNRPLARISHTPLEQASSLVVAGEAESRYAECGERAVLGRFSDVVIQHHARRCSSNLADEAAWFVRGGLTRRGVQRVEGGKELLLMRVRRVHRELHSSHTGRHRRADLQQLQADRAGAGSHELSR